MTTEPTAAPTTEELGAALSAKRRLFIDHYIQNGLNSRQASRDAKYSTPNEGYRILRSPEVQAYFQARLTEVGFSPAEVIRRLGYQAEGSMSDFLRLAETERSYWMPAHEHKEVRRAARRADVSPEELDDDALTELFGPNAVAQTADGKRLVLVKEVTDQVEIDWRGAEQAQALGRIKKIKIGEHGVVEFELHDPTRALELIGKNLKLFTDRTEHSGGVDLGVKYIAGLSEDDL